MDPFSAQAITYIAALEHHEQQQKTYAAALTWVAAPVQYVQQQVIYASAPAATNAAALQNEQQHAAYTASPQYEQQQV